MFKDNVPSVFLKIYVHVDKIFIYIIFFRVFVLTHNVYCEQLKRCIIAERGLYATQHM